MQSIDQDNLLQSIEYVALDVETTGLDPSSCRLVEIAAVKFRADAHETSTFAQLINPGVAIPHDAAAIHGITDNMVKDKPNEDTVLRQFFDWVGPNTTMLIAHNASFDFSFINSTISRSHITHPEHLVVDTLELSRALIFNTRNYQLATLVKTLNISTGQFHRALADSHHVRSLFLYLLSKLPTGATMNNISKLTSIKPMSEFPTKRHLSVSISQKRKHGF